MVVFALMMDRELQDCLSHALLINVLEFAKDFDQKVILVGAAVANIDENFPWLKNFVDQLKMLEAAAFPQNVERWEFKIAVDLARILMQRRPQRSELAELALERIYEILL